MSYEYKKHAMVDGKKYGPTAGGRYYQPADYHGKVKDCNKKGRKAKNKEHEVKTHWVRTKSEQYDVFMEGENNEFIDTHMYLVLEALFKVGFCLPAGPYVSDEDVRYIVDCIKEAIA